MASCEAQKPAINIKGNHMSSYNNMTVAGSVGTIKELRGTAEMPVLSFSVATNDWVGKGKGEAKPDGSPSDYKTTWHDVTVFGKTAESLSKRLGKGDKVVASGPISKETYAKKDGSGSALSVTIMAREVNILTSKGAAGTQASTSATATASGVDFDSIPF